MSNKQTFNSYIRNKQSFTSSVRNKQSFSSYIKNKQSFSLFIDGFVPSTSWILHVIVPAPTLAVSQITSVINITANMIIPTILLSIGNIYNNLDQSLYTTIDAKTINLITNMKMTKNMELVNIVLNLTTSFIAAILWNFYPIVVNVPKPKLEFTMTQTNNYMLSRYDPDLLSVWDATNLSAMDNAVL